MIPSHSGGFDCSSSQRRYVVLPVSLVLAPVLPRTFARKPRFPRKIEHSRVQNAAAKFELEKFKNPCPVDLQRRRLPETPASLSTWSRLPLTTVPFSTGTWSTTFLTTWSSACAGGLAMQSGASNNQEAEASNLTGTQSGLASSDAKGQGSNVGRLSFPFRFFQEDGGRQRAGALSHSVASTLSPFGSPLESHKRCSARRRRVPKRRGATASATQRALCLLLSAENNIGPACRSCVEIEAREWQ